MNLNSNDLTFAFLQINAILQPKTIGTGRNKTVEIDPENIDKLLAFDFNEHLKETRVFVGIETKLKSDNRFHGTGRRDHFQNEMSDELHYRYVKIGIRGEGFHYTFEPGQAAELRKRLKPILPKVTTVPEIITDELKPVCTLDKSDIAVVKMVSKFLGKDELRPALSCLYFKDSFAVGCDTMQLVRRPVSYSGELYIMPEGIKFIKAAKDLCIISENEKQLKLQSGSKILFIDKYDTAGGIYPDYMPILAKQMNNTVIVNRELLIQAICQAKTYANQSSCKITLDFCEKDIVVGAMDVDFATHSNVFIPEKNKWNDRIINFVSDTQDGHIAFNSEFLLNVLTVSKDETVTIRLTEGQGQTFIDNDVLMAMYEEPEKVTIEVKCENAYNGSFDKGAIMRNAWKLYRKEGGILSWRGAMLKAWDNAKHDRIGYRTMQKNIGIAA